MWCAGAAARACLKASLEDAHVIDALAHQLLVGAPLGSHHTLVVYELVVTTGAVRGSGQAAYLAPYTHALYLLLAAVRLEGTGSALHLGSACLLAHMYAPMRRRVPGTSSNVYVDIVGTEGSCLDCKLEEDDRDFQTGAVSRFVLVGQSVGAPTRLTFRVDLSGFSPSWLLHHVEVRIKGTKGKAALDEHADAGVGFWSAAVDTWLSMQAKAEVHVPLAFVPHDHAPSSSGRLWCAYPGVCCGPIRAPSDQRKCWRGTRCLGRRAHVAAPRQCLH